MAASLLLLAALAGPGRAQEAPGRRLMLAAGCFACHRVDGVGGNAGPDLSYVGIRRSKAWLQLWLREPHAWKKDTLMPDFRLMDASRGAIVEYLSSLRGGGRGAAPPWGGAGAERGKKIYRYAGCVACHGVRGAGGMPNNNVHGGEIPALNHLKEGFTLDELETMIRRGSTPIVEDVHAPPPLVFMPAWGQVLSEDEIADVSQYVLSFSTATVAPEW